MVGRITSEGTPCRNEHGVPYLNLFQAEKKQNARLLARYRAALEAWIEADQAAKNSRQRRGLMVRARNLTESALS